MTHYPIVFETEESGAISAYVPGLPVYAAADTRREAEEAIRDALENYLSYEPSAPVSAEVRIARVVNRRVNLVGLGAALGAKRSARKAKASRLNGLKGGRPAYAVVRMKTGRKR